MLKTGSNGISNLLLACLGRILNEEVNGDVTDAGLKQYRHIDAVRFLVN